MKTPFAIVLLLCGAFLLMSPVLIPLFASAGDVRVPTEMSGFLGRVLVPLVGLVMIVGGVTGALMSARRPGKTEP